MPRKKNRNIDVIKKFCALENELDYEDFEYKEKFSHICNLVPNKDQEKLDIAIIDKDTIGKKGLVYVFVIDGKVFKVGHTITDISKRIQSYNCGKVDYRINGTNSTTNYFVLQSLLNINRLVEVHAHYPDQPSYDVFGITYKDGFPPSKRAEKVILASMKKKPIGCTQR